MASVRLDRGQLRRVFRNASMQELRTVAPQVVNRAKVLVPVDTGRLRASIGPAVYSRTWTLRPRATIDVGVDYADAVHNGTRAHTVRPRPGRQGRPKARGGNKPTYLRFVVNGRVVFAREVHIPAQRGRPFLDRAVREVTAGRGYRVSEG